MFKSDEAIHQSLPYQKISKSGDDNTDCKTDRNENGHESPERGRPTFRATGRGKSSWTK